MGDAYRLTWEVRESYTLDGDGWYYPASEDREVYAAGAETTLPTELARVCNPAGVRIERQLEHLESFYKRFGRLGQTELGRKARMVLRDGKRTVSHGDEMAWAMAHAQNVATCLYLIGAAKRGNEERIRSVLQAMQQRQEELGRTHVPAGADIVGINVPFDRLLNRLHPVPAAYELAADLVNHNLHGARRVIVDGKSLFEFDALIQVIYWQLADWINVETLVECKVCRSFFYAKHGRQEMCPPVRGRRESLCSRRFRG